MKITKMLALLLGLQLLTSCSKAVEPATQEASDPAPASNGFLVYDGDVWVQVGDSITEQKLYTTYLEAFIRARYPRLKFIAVNSGKSGEVTIQGLIRFRRSIAAFKPTLVTSAYGMNDHTKVFPGEQNFDEVPNSAAQRFADAIKATGARWVVISASPLLAPADYANDGGQYQLNGQNTSTVPSGWRSNPVNKLFADKMRLVAEKNHALYLDQMTPLQTIWGQNYERDRVAAFRHALIPVLDVPITPENFQAQGLLFSNAVKPFLNNTDFTAHWPAPDNQNLLAQWQGLHGGKAEKWEPFRQYLVTWAQKFDAENPPFVQVSGYTGSSRPIDIIHPNEAGHLHMAGVVFHLMGGDGLVSSVSIDAKNVKGVQTKKATVRDVAYAQNTLTFKRLDESLPLPIDALARPALGLDVATDSGSPRDLFGMSRYLLAVTNLPAGDYVVGIDGVEIMRATSAALAHGIDLGLADKGPIYEQTQTLLAAVTTNLHVANLKGENVPGADFGPYLVKEADPVEHEWSVRPVK